MEEFDSEGKETKDEFVGLFIEPSWKTKIEEEARRKEISISEVVRQSIQRGVEPSRSRRHERTPARGAPSSSLPPPFRKLKCEIYQGVRTIIRQEIGHGSSGKGSVAPCFSINEFAEAVRISWSEAEEILTDLEVEPTKVAGQRRYDKGEVLAALCREAGVAR